jgi:hypothetical protein
MSKLTIFRNAYVQELRNDVIENMDFYRNQGGKIVYGNENTLTSKVEIADVPPTLDPSVLEDINNAIKIYEYLPIDNTQASDIRLWIYLTHITFKDYLLVRWPVGESGKQKRVIERWFLTGNARSLSRNAISHLWWATRLTVAPWETDDDYFAQLKNDDRYIYTKALLRIEDATSALMERKLSWSKRILIAILEYMRKHDEFAYKRSFYRNMLKEVVLALGYRKIMMLSFDELLTEIDGIASEIHKETE